jgi:DNA-directed RNA polymerase specialized sigma24 family protein
MDFLLPELDALRAGHEKAWALAYPPLWEAGMRIARIRLAGERFEPDREDLVSTALQQVISGICGKAGESFNQISTWDDVLVMMRHIVRLRVTDFFRSAESRKEDAVEELPEIIDAAPEMPRFQLNELMKEVDHLEPNPPVPQLFRDRFIEGWSTDEIAERRKINRNTLLTHFAKGFRVLRERLSRLEGPLS